MYRKAERSYPVGTRNIKKKLITTDRSAKTCGNKNEITSCISAISTCVNASSPRIICQMSQQLDTIGLGTKGNRFEGGKKKKNLLKSDAIS